MMEMRVVLLLVLRSFDFETIGMEPNKSPKSTHTDLDTIYGDQVFQDMGVGARPRGGHQMKVKFASQKS